MISKRALQYPTTGPFSFLLNEALREQLKNMVRNCMEKVQEFQDSVLQFARFSICSLKASQSISGDETANDLETMNLLQKDHQWAKHQEVCYSGVVA